MRTFVVAGLATAALLTVSASFSSTAGSRQTALSAPAQKTTDGTLSGFPMCGPRLVRMDSLLARNTMHILHIDCN